MKKESFPAGDAERLIKNAEQLENLDENSQKSMKKDWADCLAARDNYEWELDNIVKIMQSAKNDPEAVKKAEAAIEKDWLPKVKEALHSSIEAEYQFEKKWGPGSATANVLRDVGVVGPSRKAVAKKESSSAWTALRREAENHFKLFE